MSEVIGKLANSLPLGWLGPMRWSWLLPFALLACDDGGNDLGDPADVGPENLGFGLVVPDPDVEACGPAGALGTECSVLDQCGVDPNRNPAQWDQESDQGRTGLCLAGACFEFDRLDRSGFPLTGFLILTDQQIRYGRSYIGSVIAPMTADGRTLACEDFLALDGCDPVLNEVQVVNTTRLGLVGNQVDDAVRLTNNVPPGEWIFTVGFYTGGEGRGRLVDYGCQDDIVVDGAGHVFVNGALSQAQDGTFGVQFEFADRSFGD